MINPSKVVFSVGLISLLICLGKFKLYFLKYSLRSSVPMTLTILGIWSKLSDPLKNVSISNNIPAKVHPSDQISSE